MNLSRFQQANSRLNDLITQLSPNFPDETTTDTDTDTDGWLVDIPNQTYSASSGTIEQARYAIQKRIRHILIESNPLETPPTLITSLEEQLYHENKIQGRPFLRTLDRQLYPRIPSEEGHYTPPLAYIPPHNAFLTESRLLREDPLRRTFFTPNGTFRAPLDFLGPSSVRSIETDEDELSTIQAEQEKKLLQPYQSANSGNTNFSNYSWLNHPRLSSFASFPTKSIEEVRWFSFLVHIDSIKLTSHPLFSLEDVLCQSLRQEIGIWQTRISLIDSFTSDINLDVLETLKNSNTDIVSEIQSKSHILPLYTYGSLEHRATGAVFAAETALRTLASSPDSATNPILRSNARNAAEVAIGLLAMVRERRLLKDRILYQSRTHLRKIYKIWSQIKEIRQSTFKQSQNERIAVARAAKIQSLAGDARTHANQSYITLQDDQHNENYLSQGMIQDPVATLYSSNTIGQPTGYTAGQYASNPTQLKMKSTKPDTNGVETENMLRLIDEQAEIDEIKQVRGLLLLLQLLNSPSSTTVLSKAIGKDRNNNASLNTKPLTRNEDENSKNAFKDSRERVKVRLSLVISKISQIEEKISEILKSKATLNDNNDLSTIETTTTSTTSSVVSPRSTNLEDALAMEQEIDALQTELIQLYKEKDTIQAISRHFDSDIQNDVVYQQYAKYIQGLEDAEESSKHSKAKKMPTSIESLLTSGASFESNPAFTSTSTSSTTTSKYPSSLTLASLLTDISPLNEDKERQKIRQRILQARGSSSEPLLSPILSEDGYVCPDAYTTRAERRRRHALRSQGYELELYINGALVTISRPCELTDISTWGIVSHPESMLHSQASSSSQGLNAAWELQANFSVPLRLSQCPRSIILVIKANPPQFSYKNSAEKEFDACNEDHEYYHPGNPPTWQGKLMPTIHHQLKTPTHRFQHQIREKVAVIPLPIPDFSTPPHISDYSFQSVLQKSGPLSISTQYLEKEAQKEAIFFQRRSRDGKTPQDGQNMQNMQNMPPPAYGGEFPYSRTIRGIVSATVFWDLSVEARLDRKLARFLEPPRLGPTLYHAHNHRRYLLQRKFDRLRKAEQLHWKGSPDPSDPTSIPESFGMNAISSQHTQSVISALNALSFHSAMDEGGIGNGVTRGDSLEHGFDVIDDDYDDTIGFEGYNVHPDLLLFDSSADLFATSADEVAINGNVNTRKAILLARKVTGVNLQQSGGNEASNSMIASSRSSLASDLTTSTFQSPGSGMSSIPSSSSVTYTSVTSRPNSSAVTYVEQIVRDVSDPDLLFFNFVTTPTRPNRPLHVYRNVRLSTRLQSLINRPQTALSYDLLRDYQDNDGNFVVVQVIRATNVPLRSSVLRSGSATGLQGPRSPMTMTNVTSKNNTVLCTCFVHLEFLYTKDAQMHLEKLGADKFTLQDGKSSKNPIAVTKPVILSHGSGLGANPSWDQVLTLPIPLDAGLLSTLGAHGSLDPLTLLTIISDIKVTLFDLTITNKTDTGRNSSNNSSNNGGMSLHFDKRYLGDFTIPFTKIVESGTMEEIFEVNVPLLQFEYEKLHPDELTTLHLYINLEPNIAPSRTVLLPSDKLAIALGIPTPNTPHEYLSSMTSMHSFLTSPSSIGSIDIKKKQVLLHQQYQMQQLQIQQQQQQHQHQHQQQQPLQQSQQHLTSRPGSNDMLINSTSVNQPVDFTISTNTFQSATLGVELSAFGSSVQAYEYVDSGIASGTASLGTSIPIDYHIMQILSPAQQWILQWTREIAFQMQDYLRPNCVTIIPNIALKPVLLFRYLTPQQPPLSCSHSPAAFIRFVAQIPTLRSQHISRAASVQFHDLTQAQLSQSHKHGKYRNQNSSDIDNSPQHQLLDNLASLVKQRNKFQPIDFSSFLGANSQAETWSTSSEFLELGVGDTLEHTILLCNYFYWWEMTTGSITSDAMAEPTPNSPTTMYDVNTISSTNLHWETYLLIGESCFHRRSFWTLRLSRREHDRSTILDRIIYDSLTGHSYSLDYDSHLLPLKSVSLLVTPTNIYFNMQKQCAPIVLDFNVYDTISWAPLFGFGFGSRMQLRDFAHIFGQHEVKTIQVMNLEKEYQLSNIQARIIEKNWGFHVSDIMKTDKTGSGKGMTMATTTTPTQTQVLSPKDSEYSRWTLFSPLSIANLSVTNIKNISTMVTSLPSKLTKTIATMFNISDTQERIGHDIDTVKGKGRKLGKMGKKIKKRHHHRDNDGNSSNDNSDNDEDSNDDGIDSDDDGKKDIFVDPEEVSESDKTVAELAFSSKYIQLDAIALVRLWNTIAFQLERTIQKSIESWRISYSSTKWSLGASKRLKELLLQCEGVELREYTNLVDRSPLSHIKNSFTNIHAFPLHFPCVITDSLLLDTSCNNPILDTIHQTKIHESKHSDVVFSVAVYIHPYTSKFASLWVFLASMTPIK